MLLGQRGGGIHLHSDDEGYSNINSKQYTRKISNEIFTDESVQGPLKKKKLSVCGRGMLNKQGLP
jgi:hypothetical protein